MYNLGYLYFQMAFQNKSLSQQNSKADAHFQFQKAASMFQKCIALADSYEQGVNLGMTTDCYFNLG